MPELKQGSRGVEVKKLQLLLNSKLMPSPRLPLDGQFGPKTAQAVRRLQEARNLTADGVVGPKTWAALGQQGVMPMRQEISMCVLDAPWVEIAALELGIAEDSRQGFHTKRILEYHQATSLKATTDEVAWCSSFVNWVMVQAGYIGTNNALARSWLTWGRPLDPPRIGAITVIKKKGATGDVVTGSTTGYHVAFFVASSASHVRLLGGNQSDRVRYSSFALSSYGIEGYRWPK